MDARFFRLSSAQAIVVGSKLKNRPKNNQKRTLNGENKNQNASVQKGHILEECVHGKLYVCQITLLFLSKISKYLLRINYFAIINVKKCNFIAKQILIMKLFLVI